MNFESINRAVLLTDIVDSASHLEALGDLKFAETMSELESTVRHLIRQHNGREIDKTDGFLIVFSSPLDGLAFGLHLNREMSRFSKSHNRKFRLRTGIHYGTLVVRSNTPEHIAVGAKSLEIDGLTKIIAARITALADPAQILVTRSLFDIVREDENTSELIPDSTRWLAHGPYLLYGLNDPVEIFEVGEEHIAPLMPPSNKDKARRAILPQDEFALGWRPAAGQFIPSAQDWKLVRKLGEGGYGEVWLAEHRKARQSRVFKFCFDPARMRSLKREKFLLNTIQENLGMRDDIVRIVNWNMTEVPYFIALQYIPVDNLAAYMDHRQDPHPLPLSTILHIVRSAAEAIAAAHSVGILHKDIKPSNLLIGGDPARPTIHLIDFGIGLYTPVDQEQQQSELDVTTESDRTTLRTSSLSGSRMYVAPEVVEGQMPTTQADIYALGVILYQLLRNDLHVGLKVGWERNIPDPMLTDLIARATDGDLRNRLQTVNVFIDLLDSLEDRRRQAAISRNNEERLERDRLALEQTRRRKIYYAIGLAVAIPMAVISGTFAYRASEESGKARLQTLRASIAREKADNLVNFMLEDLTRELKKAGALPLMDSVTSQALRYYSDESMESLGNNELYNRAQALNTLGDILYDRVEIPEAEKNFSSAEAIVNRLLESEPDNIKYRILLGTIYHNQAVVAERKNRGGASTLYNKALELRKQLYEEQPAYFDNAKNYIRTCQVYGYFLSPQTSGSMLMEEAIKISEAVLQREPSSVPAKQQYAASLYYASLDDSSITTETTARRSKAVQLYLENSQAEPLNMEHVVDLINGYTRLATCYQDDPPKALRQCILAAEQCDRLTAKDSTNLEWCRIIGRSMKKYADCAMKAGDVESAAYASLRGAEELEKILRQNVTDSWVRTDYWNLSRAAQQYLGRLSRHEEQLKSLKSTEQFYKVASQLNPLKSRDEYYFTRAHFLATQIAIHLHDPEYLEKALQETTSTAGGMFGYIHGRCAERLASRSEPFDFSISEWKRADYLSPDTTATFHLTVINTLPEILVVRCYLPGQVFPFDQQMVAASTSDKSGVFNQPVFNCNDAMGVSINGSPIYPLKDIAVLDEKEKTYILETEDWATSHAAELKYRIPVPINVSLSGYRLQM